MIVNLIQYNSEVQFETLVSTFMMVWEILKIMTLLDGTRMGFCWSWKISDIESEQYFSDNWVLL